jgi:DNA-binding NtrC family response regulator
MPAGSRALIERFLDECRRQWGVAANGVEPEVLERLRSYEWPGNIRQLRNAIERAALVAPGHRVRIADLPPYLRAQPTNTSLLAAAPHASPATQTAPGDPLLNADGGLKPALRDYESRMIQRALARTGGNRHAAAKLLRVPRRTLYRRLQVLGFAPLGDSTSTDVEIEPA